MRGRMSLSVMLSGWKMLNPFTPPKTISPLRSLYDAQILKELLCNWSFTVKPDRVIPGIEAGDSVAADPEGSVVVLLQALQFVIEEPGVGCVETAETGRFPAATTFGHKEETFADRCDPKTPLLPVTVNRRDEGIGTTHLPFTAFVAASSIRWRSPCRRHRIRFGSAPSGFRSRWSYCR